MHAHSGCDKCEHANKARAALLAAAEAALDYMPGGYQASRCHAGMMTQQECSTCKAKDALRAAISQARGEA